MIHCALKLRLSRAFEMNDDERGVVAQIVAAMVEERTGQPSSGFGSGHSVERRTNEQVAKPFDAEHRSVRRSSFDDTIGKEQEAIIGLERVLHDLDDIAAQPHRQGRLTDQVAGERTVPDEERKVVTGIYPFQFGRQQVDGSYDACDVVAVTELVLHRLVDLAICVCESAAFTPDVPNGVDGQR
jgi:hypothetical protein